MILAKPINLVKNLFSCDYLLKKTEILGEIPSTLKAYKTTLLMAYPSFVELFLICLITSIDTVMVGSISIEAISAVGITAQPKFIILAPVLSLNIGVTAIVSRRKGAGDMLAANNCLKQGLLLSTILSFTFCSLGYIFARPFLTFVGAGADIIDMATIYFQITIIGLFFHSMSLTINAAQKGVGNTKVSMQTNLNANIVNLVFNYLLINGVLFFPQLGVTGAAIATLLGNIVAFVLSLISVSRNKDSNFLSIFSFGSWKFTRENIKNLSSVGFSAFVEQIFMRIGFLATTMIIASLGTVEFGTHQIGMSIMNFSFSGGDGIAIAATSLVGQNLGKKRPDLSMLYCKISQRIAFLYSCTLCVIFVFGRHALIDIFTDEPEVIATGSVLMLLLGIITYFQTSQVVITSCLRGAGDTKFTAISSFICIAIIRTVFTYILCYPAGFGLYGVWLAIIIDMIFRFTINSLRFKTGKWAKIKL